MFSRNVATFVLCLLSLATFIHAEEPGVIEALLRKPYTRRAGSALVIRQGTCSIGYLPCSDGNGCCPVGKYCGVWGGKLGCCTIGRTCIANSNPCDYQGDLPCPGENFCCPAGDTCYRDAAGNARCRDGAGFTTTTRRTTTFTPIQHTITNINTVTAPTFTPIEHTITTVNVVTTPVFTPTNTRTTTTRPTAPAVTTSLDSGDSGPLNIGNGAPPTVGAVSAVLALAGLAVNVLGV
ncbi:hypothetical protein Hypma_010933 [Hypsizygus marmoreus]|uniref:Uncharacterized protein n=1 Tax=Hypsizygus marmoreus TaxID=39966 RepID=A0A369JJC3_HYPMA|nr:hypothetical protein Hypma_010933 [Hypsizygus marmoreus]